MNRRHFLLSTAATFATVTLARGASSRPATTKSSDIPDNLSWHDVRDWGVEGRGFDDTENYFDRLPARAKPIVRDAVWILSQDSAGISVRFEADTTAIYVRYALRKSNLAMGHMPATGVSGCDLYGRDEKGWHWIATKTPAEQDVVGALSKQIAPGKRTYVINFPLYNGVKSFEIGLPKDAAFAPIPPRKEKPILIYGTSITQGGCASRPGMAFPAILGRRLDRPMLNFGFSGNGRMEVEVAQFLAELDPAIFILDCVANMGAVPATERTIAVVKLLREHHKETPILLLDERIWASAPLVPHLVENHKERSAELRAAYDQLKSAGVENLHFRPGDDLIGADGEATVDGSHPTDLGMMRYADALEPDLRRLVR